jgi:glutathione S-transferase
MIVLYGFLPSGNVYKIRLLFSHLRIAHRRIEVAQTAGHTRLPTFRQINPIGKVPVVKLEDGSVLTESGAILILFFPRHSVLALGSSRTDRNAALDVL